MHAPDSKASPRLLADRYLLVESLGGGGGGGVYRSFDRELEEWVAVKLLRGEGFAGEAARADLRRQVKLARRVTHPNVARVHELGRVGDELFVTMEYIAAETLDHHLARAGRLPPEQIPGLAIDLCRGLAAAHAAGVVHGDLTPRAILLAPGRGAVITDFGIPRGPARGPARVHDGATRYTAPEQLAGAEPSPRTDLYAFGVMLFEALTGMSPWPGDDAGGRRGDAEPDLRALAPTLVGGWLELIGACLRQRPEARPVDAQEVLAELLALYRGTTHVAVAVAEADDLPLEPPTAARRWISVLPFTAADPELQRHTGWISGDLVQALRHVPSLRVVTDGHGHGHGPLPQIRGELHELGDAVRIAVHVTDVDADGFVLTLPRGLLPYLGVELAARVLDVLHVRAQHHEPTSPQLLHPDAVDLYIQARAALLAMRTGDAVRGFEAALALGPRHRALRVGHLQARLRHAILFRSPSAEELEELSALAEATVAEYSGSSETCAVMASLLLTGNRPLESVRWACAAVARAPLAGMLGLIGSVLMAIGRMPDAARRFDLAAALEQHSAQLWLCRAELAGHEGRWDDFYALVRGPLKDLRTVYTLHLMLWRPDRAVTELLAAELAAGAVRQRPEALRDLQLLVDFMLDRGDRPRLLAELVAIHGAGPRTFHTRRMHMILCDMACVVGDLALALDLLERADAQSLIEWQWLTHSPLLAVIRGEPRYLEVRARVRERADAVAEVIWG